MSKPRLSPAKVRASLARELGSQDLELKPATEGEESQVFVFDWQGQACVLRINPSADGFYKDQLANERFSSPEVPIPRVIKIGQIDADHAYCISEKLPGATLQDSDADTIKALLGPTTALLRAIGSVDISGTEGFGAFDRSGQAPSRSWQEALLELLDEKRHDWRSVRNRLDASRLDAVLKAYRDLCSACPEERRLVHGDFGSNNVLTDGYRITGVLDWENAMYGDPLFDAATVYFWRTWLECMELQANYFETQFTEVPNYRERLKCYQLRIGLWEIYDNTHDDDLKMANWALDRCLEVMNGS